MITKLQSIGPEKLGKEEGSRGGSPWGGEIEHIFGDALGAGRDQNRRNLVEKRGRESVQRDCQNWGSFGE